MQSGSPKLARAGRLNAFLFGLAGGLVGGLAAAGLVVLAQEWDIKLGNVAEWTAGLGTIGALLYAGTALRYEIKERAAAERRLARSEVRRVSIELVHGYIAGQGGHDPQRTYAVVGNYLLKNDSLYDLSDVEIAVLTDTGEHLVVPVGEFLSGREIARDFEERGPIAEKPDGGLMLEARFTDPSGTRWARRSDGALVELPDRTPNRKGTRSGALSEGPL